jgi:hypothetical protein
MRVRVLALLGLAPLVLTLVSLAMSTWGAAGPCAPEPFGC